MATLLQAAPSPALATALTRTTIEDALWSMISTWLDESRDERTCLRVLHQKCLALCTSGLLGKDLAKQQVESLELRLRELLLRGQRLNLQEHMQVSDILLGLRHDLSPALAWEEPQGLPWVCFLGPVEGLESIPDHALASGYRIDIFPDEASLVARTARRTPDLLCLDLSHAFPGPDGSASFLSRLQAGRSHPIPVAFLSDRADLDARLAALRAGGVAFFPSPINVRALTEKLEHLVRRAHQEPFRILIVEDEPISAAFCSRILEAQGMEVVTVTDPLKAMQPLVELRPDLVLMDLHMPGCSGEELASVIRQEDAFVGLPIVYLSAERNREHQLAALNLGAEDFVTKPVSPSHLVSIVTTRVLRGRQLRSLMERDRLTGLLNYASLKEHLRREIGRAERSHAPLTYAMIDLDHFKQVNDAHGHPAGDSVLVNLARLLQRRLRRTDIIGRYGGEEFAVILPETSLEEARGVMEDLRQSFQDLPHLLDGEAVHLTFSCGLAAAEDFSHPMMLIRAADAALYEAKGAGRNRVVCHRAPATPVRLASAQG